MVNVSVGIICLCVTDKSINIQANDRKTRTNKLVKPHVVVLLSSWSAILRGESEWANGAVRWHIISECTLDKIRPRRSTAFLITRSILCQHQSGSTKAF